MFLGKSQIRTRTVGFGLVQTGSQSVQDQTSPTLAPVVEAGPSVEMERMMARDAVEELLGIWPDGMSMVYIKLSLVEIAWHNYQETCKLCKSSDRQE